MIPCPAQSRLWRPSANPVLPSHGYGGRLWFPVLPCHGYGGRLWFPVLPLSHGYGGRLWFPCPACHGYGDRLWFPDLPCHGPWDQKALPVLSCLCSPCVVCLCSPCVVCPLLSLCCLSLFPSPRSQTLPWFPAWSAFLRWSPASVWCLLLRSGGLLPRRGGLLARVWWSSVPPWWSSTPVWWFPVLSALPWWALVPSAPPWWALVPSAPPWWALVPSAPSWWALVPSAPPWWALVPSAPSWWALVPSAPPWWALVPSAPPWWAPVPSAPPWLPALPQFPASPLAHGPGPPSLPLFHLYSTTLLDHMNASGSRSLGGAMFMNRSMHFHSLTTWGHSFTTLTLTPHYCHYYHRTAFPIIHCADDTQLAPISHYPDCTADHTITHTI